MKQRESLARAGRDGQGSCGRDHRGAVQVDHEHGAEEQRLDPTCADGGIRVRERRTGLGRIGHTVHGLGSGRAGLGAPVIYEMSRSRVRAWKAARSESKRP
jgi:hypothetical protein